MRTSLPHGLLVVSMLGALASAALASTNHAPRRIVPPATNATFAFGHATRLSVHNAELEIWTGGRELEGTLRLVLATWDEDPNDRSILIAVPPGTEIRTLGMVLGEQHFRAIARRADLARSEYEAVVREMKDPALLEWVRSSSRQTWLRLRVFPVVAGRRATIELGFVTPRRSSIAIDPGAFHLEAARIAIDDRVYRIKPHSRLEAPVPADPDADARDSREPSSFVNCKHSLYAGPEQEVLDPDEIGDGTIAAGDYEVPLPRWR